METPTGYRRWLIGLIISVLGFGGSILYATYATGQQAKQVETNTGDIEKLEKRIEGFATRDDINRMEKQLNRLEDKLDRLSERR